MESKFLIQDAEEYGHEADEHYSDDFENNDSDDGHVDLSSDDSVEHIGEIIQDRVEQLLDGARHLQMRRELPFLDFETFVASSSIDVRETSVALDMRLQELSRIHEALTKRPTRRTAEDLRRQLSDIRCTLASCSLDGLQTASRTVLVDARAFCAVLQQRLDWVHGIEQQADVAKMKTSQAENANPELQHELSREQQFAVDCPSSVFIQGRSGTGKTLVLVQRMIKHGALPVNTKALQVRQLFVTKSSMLRDEVARCLTNAGCTLESPNKWPPQGICCLTWDELVELLIIKDNGDGSMRNGSTVRAVVNYDRFQRMYWDDISQSHAGAKLPMQVAWCEFMTRLRPFESTSVTVSQRKPQIRCRQNRAESDGSLDFDWVSGLSLTEYLKDDLAAVGIRLQRAEQLRLYDMFQRYTRLKLANHEMDDVDVAAQVMKTLMNSTRTWVRVDKLYVDEAQDFSPAELSVLLALCHNPDGVSVAGDTCQTINPGSAFSFEDIVRAFGFLWEGHGHTISKGGSSRTINELIANARQSQILTLQFNYRCAPGVACLASSVSSLLLERFPYSADHIDEETFSGEVYQRAIFMSMPGINPSRCIMGEGLARVNAVDPSRIAILVRNDHRRQHLRALGVQATILTTSEAKGLEFDIVVLCGMFADCPDCSVWSLADPTSEASGIASLIVQAQPLLYGGNAIAALNAEQHKLLFKTVLAIPELKSLYVAITRARSGCVLLECDFIPEDNALIGCWSQRNLVEQWDTERYLHEVVLPDMDVTLDHQIDMPSFVPAMERRFGGIKPSEDLLLDLHAQGLQLLRHAEDAKRDRWQVFAEAASVFLQAITTSDVALATQLQLGSSVALTTVTTDRTDYDLQRQLATVIQEACRRPSWRGRSLAQLLARSLWEHIFSFLTGFGESEIHMLMSLALQHVAEHAEQRGRFFSKLVLSRAWHKLCQVRFEPGVGEIVNKLRGSVDEMCKRETRRAANDDSSRIKDEGYGNDGSGAGLTEDAAEEAAAKLGQLGVILSAHAEGYVTAVGPFLAARRSDVAADTAEEARIAVDTAPQLMRKLLQAHTEASSMRCFAADSPLVHSMAALECRSQELGLLAARCRLLSSAQKVEDDRDVTLQLVETHLLAAGCPVDAALVGIWRQCPHASIEYLRDVEGKLASQLRRFCEDLAGADGLKHGEALDMIRDTFPSHDWTQRWTTFESIL